MSLLLALILAFLVLLASVTVVLIFIGPVMLLQPRRRGPDYYRGLGQYVSPGEADLRYEEINIITEDGLKLNSWLVKGRPDAPGTVIYLHGVADCKIDGIRFAEFMHDNGFNVFLYDSRRHGNSEGTFCTYGFFEKHDLSTVIDYLESRTDLRLGKIGLFGTSMGAAVALQAAATDRRIAAVVAENSFATLRSIFDDYQRRIIKLPFHYLRNLVIKRSEHMARFRANDVSPLEAVKAVRIPVLFIYATQDQLINARYSLILHEQAVGPKELFPVENASHHNTWEMAGHAYEHKLLTFFGTHLR